MRTGNTTTLIAHNLIIGTFYLQYVFCLEKTYHFAAFWPRGGNIKEVSVSIPPISTKPFTENIHFPVTTITSWELNYGSILICLLSTINITENSFSKSPLFSFSVENLVKAKMLLFSSGLNTRPFFA